MSDIGKHEHDWRPVTEINNQGQVQQCAYCGKVRDTRDESWEYGIVGYSVIGGLFFYAAFMMYVMNETTLNFQKAAALYVLSIVVLALIPVTGFAITKIYRWFR